MGPLLHTLPLAAWALWVRHCGFRLCGFRHCGFRLCGFRHCGFRHCGFRHCWIRLLGLRLLGFRQVLPIACVIQLGMLASLLGRMLNAVDSLWPLLPSALVVS